MEVVAGVFIREGKVLVFEKPGKGYEFPGGKVESGETHRQALERELEEELGIRCEAGERLAVASYGKVDLFAYQANCLSGIIRMKEHTWMQAVDQDLLPGLRLCPPDADILGQLFREETAWLETPMGILRIRGNRIHITEVALTGENRSEEASGLPAEARKQLQEYVRGSRKEFTLPLCLKGTPFQVDIWKKTREIPYGETRTYAQVDPRARAVGNALHQNRLLILIPCHRVVARKSMGGFGVGKAAKQYLLNLEKTTKESGNMVQNSG